RRKPVSVQKLSAATTAWRSCLGIVLLARESRIDEYRLWIWRRQTLGGSSLSGCASHGWRRSAPFRSEMLATIPSHLGGAGFFSRRMEGHSGEGPVPGGDRGDRHFSIG